MPNCSLEQVLVEVSLLVSKKAQEQEVAVRFESVKDVVLWGEDTSIEQVLYSLISQRMDALREKLGRWIRVSAFEDNVRVVLQIRDSCLDKSVDSGEQVLQISGSEHEGEKNPEFGLARTKEIFKEWGATIHFIAGNDPRIELRFRRASC